MINEPYCDPMALASFIRFYHGQRAFDVASDARDENELAGNHRAADLWGRAASALWTEDKQLKAV
jgi:hypothetical protein